MSRYIAKAMYVAKLWNGGCKILLFSQEMIAIGCSTGHTLVDGCCLTLSRCCLVASADEECAGEIQRREEEEEALAAE